MSDYSFRPLKDTDQAEWQGLWLRSEKHFFLHWRWVEVAAAGVGRAVRIGVFDRTGAHLLAGVAFVERPNRRMLEWRHPAPAPFAGILCAIDNRSESFLRDAFEAVAAAVPPSIDVADIILHPGLQDARGLTWSGWQAEPYYNYTSNIANPEEFQTAAENAVQRQAEKARRAGLQSMASVEQLQDVLTLWETTRRRHKLREYVHPDAWRALAAWMHRGTEPLLEIDVLGIRKQGGPLEAGCVLGKDANRVYFLLGASDPDRYGDGSPTLLHFEAAALASSRRWPGTYDWVGANTPSIAQFKKKFRPNLELLIRAVRKRARRRLMEEIRKMVKRE